MYMRWNANKWYCNNKLKSFLDDAESVQIFKAIFASGQKDLTVFQLIIK